VPRRLHVVVRPERVRDIAKEPLPLVKLRVDVKLDLRLAPIRREEPGVAFRVAFLYRAAATAQSLEARHGRPSFSRRRNHGKASNAFPGVGGRELRGKSRIR